MDVPKTRVIVAVVGQMVIQGTCTGHLNGQVVAMLVKILLVVRYHVYNWTTILRGIIDRSYRWSDGRIHPGYMYWSSKRSSSFNGLDSMCN